eukprot:gene3194-14203_t
MISFDTFCTTVDSRSARRVADWAGAGGARRHPRQTGKRTVGAMGGYARLLVRCADCDRFRCFNECIDPQVRKF